MTLRIESTFKATDKDGNHYTVQVLRGEHPGIGYDGRETMLPDALREMRTSDGRHVNFVSANRYEIVDETYAISLTSDDPHAPQQ